MMIKIEGNPMDGIDFKGGNKNTLILNDPVTAYE
jgi:hypothetical protein